MFTWYRQEKKTNRISVTNFRRQVDEIIEQRLECFSIGKINEN
jgi:hypothetical protein